MLSPAQGIIFLGLSLDLVTFTTRLSAERVKTYMQICPIQPVSSITRADSIRDSHSPSHSPPHEGISVLCGLIQAGSRASWCTESAGHTGVCQGAAPLASFVLFYTGVPMGSILSRKVVITDASLMG